MQSNIKLYIQGNGRYINIKFDNNQILVNTNNEKSYKYKRIILTGKMSASKDYLKNKLKTIGLNADISYTTRPIRYDEIDGIDYYFISEDTFKNLINNNSLYEYDKFVDWYYGTKLNNFNNKQLFIMTPRAIDKISNEDRKDSFIIYLDFPENVRLERLKNGDMKYDSIQRRIITDEKDFEDVDYDIRITKLKIKEDEV